MSHALPRVLQLGEKAYVVSMTNGNAAHTWGQQDQENSAVWSGSSHNFHALSVGLCIQLLGHGELSGNPWESNGLKARYCWSGSL